MVKAFAIIALISIAGAAHAEDLTPWFGSEASSPSQVDMKIVAAAKLVSIKNTDCSIYDCASLVKIAKPDQKSASNP